MKKSTQVDENPNYGSYPCQLIPQEAEILFMADGLNACNAHNGSVYRGRDLNFPGTDGLCQSSVGEGEL